MIEWFKDLWTRPFVRNVIHTIFTRGLLVSMGLLSSIIITRGLGPTGKGLYALVVAAIAIGSQFGNLGLHASNTYFVAQNKRLLGFLHKNTVVISILTGTITSLIIFLIHWLKPNFFDLEHQFLPFVLFGVIFSLLSLLLRNLMIGIQKIKVNNYIELLTKFLVTSSIVLLYILDIISVQYVLIIAILEYIIWTFYLSKKLQQFSSPKGSISVKLFKKNLNYGLKAYVMGLFGFLVISSDIFLVNYYLEKEQVGFYSTAVQLATQLMMISTIVSTILLPKLSSVNNLSEKYRLNKRVINYMTVLLFFICLIGYIFADQIMVLLYGIEFLPSARIFRILLIALFFLSIESIMVQYLAAIGMPIILVFYWAVVFMINLMLNILFIPKYGEIGAAYSSLIAYGLIWVFIFTERRRNNPNNSTLQPLS